MIEAKVLTPKKFVQLIKRPPSFPWQLIRMTPELALEAVTLCDDTKQRPLSKKWVRELARRKTSGMWRLLPDPWVFDTDWRNQNGQHRAHAVLDSGVTVDVWVYFGADPSLFPFYDSGKKRNAGDIFSMRGEPNASSAAAITRAINVYHSKGYRGNSTGFPTVSTPDETFDYYLQIGCDAVQDGTRMAGRMKDNSLPNPSVIAALFVICQKETNGVADNFFDAIATGANLKPRSIERKLRDHLLVNGRDMKPSKVAADVIRAWNAKIGKHRTFSVAAFSEMPELQWPR